MTWRENLQAARFRDAAFFVEDHSLAGGRKLAIHEYPLRDLPYAEDLGRASRRFTLECYVIGDDYMNTRNALIVALEATGAGVLVHPYFGRLNVAVNQYRTRESTREGGMATFSIEFTEAGENSFPQAVSDTPKNVRKAADKLRSTAITDFLKKYSLATQPQELVNEVRAEIERVLIGVRGVVVPVAQLIALPGDLAAAVYDGLNALSATLKEPRLAFERQRLLFNAGHDAKPVPQNTPRRRQQRTNQAAAHNLIRRAAVTEAARSTASITFDSVEEAIAARDVVSAAIDDAQRADVLGEPVPDEVFEALTELRQTVVTDIKLRAAQLPRIVTRRFDATLPALLVAYRIYGDASRAEDIVKRNNIRRPGFVPGGISLEVLTDG